MGMNDGTRLIKAENADVLVRVPDRVTSVWVYEVKTGGAVTGKQ